MNPFQRARDEAHNIRRAILKERAGEPIPAKDIVALIEARLDLGIEQLPPGSPELGGGDACLRRTEKYIYVLKGIPDEKFAELVAHELGHWCLDVQKTPITVASLNSFDGLEGNPLRKDSGKRPCAHSYHLPRKTTAQPVRAIPRSPGRGQAENGIGGRVSFFAFNFSLTGVILDLGRTLAQVDQRP